MVRRCKIKSARFNKKNRFPIISIVILALLVVTCSLAPVIANHDPNGFYLESINQKPNDEFYFGTDSLGRDMFSMIWYGGRVSITIGLLGAAIITVIGVTYGCISGTASDIVDSTMMRVTELFGSVPSLLLILVLAAVFPTKNIVSISILIGITGWFGLARIVRSEVRQIRNSDYVLYARQCGGKRLYVMWQHLIPNFISAIMFVVISSVGSSITMESTLSFLGLGLPIDVISWGSMLSLANKALIMNTWWVVIVPGVFLIITLMCLTNIGNYFRKEVNRRPSAL